MGMIRQNGWVPVDKNLVKHLPTDRPFTPLEAVFSLQVDYDAGNSATVRGYAKRWRWSPGKVARFMEAIGVTIEYPEPTQKCRNQRGYIVPLKTDRNRIKKDPIRFIDNKYLSTPAEQGQSNTGEKGNQSQGPTRKTKTQTQKNAPTPQRSQVKKAPWESDFNQFWEAYPKKRGKQQAQKTWEKLRKKGQLPPVGEIIAAVKAHCETPEWQEREGKFIPYPSTWLNGGRWEDEVPPANSQQSLIEPPEETDIGRIFDHD